MFMPNILQGFGLEIVMIAEIGYYGCFRYRYHAAFRIQKR